MLAFLLKWWFSHKFYSSPIQLSQMWDILILYNPCFLETTPEAPVPWGQSVQGRPENRGIPVGRRRLRMGKTVRETLTRIWVGRMWMVRQNSKNSFYFKKYTQVGKALVWNEKLNTVFDSKKLSALLLWLYKCEWSCHSKWRTSCVLTFLNVHAMGSFRC